jgi:hypothetical protein
MVWLRCDMCGCALVVPHNFLLSCHDLATGRHNLRLTVYVQLPEHLNIPLGACGLVVCAPILRFSHTPRKYLQNTELDPRLEGTPRWMIYSKSSYRRGSLHRSDGACGPLLLFYLISFYFPFACITPCYSNLSTSRRNYDFDKMGDGAGEIQFHKVNHVSLK